MYSSFRDNIWGLDLADMQSLSRFNVKDHVRISKYKIFLLKDMFQIGQKKFLLLMRLKIQFLGLILLVI